MDTKRGEPVAEHGSNADVARLLAHYSTMTRIRAFEMAAEAAHKDGLVGGAIHLSIGQEAVASGVCANLDRADQITTTHRGHGHSLAKGAAASAMMLELFGRAGGVCGGKGGSMHIADFSVGMLGANGVVGAGMPIAVGAAHGAKIMGADRIVVCFFGDGAVNRGPFLEALNWAKIYDLDILFVCEHNDYASTTRTDSVTAGPGAAARAEAMGIEAAEIDGNDVEAVDAKAGELIERLRGGEGPFFLTARTYRLMGHTAADPGAYRTREEVAAAWQGDPIPRAAARLTELGVAESELSAIGEQASAEMAEAAARAAEAPAPDLAQAFSDIQDIGAPSHRGVGA